MTYVTDYRMQDLYTLCEFVKFGAAVYLSRLFMICVTVYRNQDLRGLSKFAKVFTESDFCGLLFQVYDANDISTLIKCFFRRLRTCVNHDISSKRDSQLYSPLGSSMSSGRVLQLPITTRQIIADAATKYVITMCAQVLQYHPSSNSNHRSVIWKLIYLAHREIPDPAYASLQYFQTNKATSDLRTKLGYRPQDISFYYFADAKPTVIWFKAFTATYLSTTKSRFLRIPTYAPCNASHTSKLHTYVATITTI